MANEITTINNWQCDICGKEDTTPHLGHPDRWNKITLHAERPKSYGSGKYDHCIFDGVACDQCCGNLDFNRHRAVSLPEESANVSLLKRLWVKLTKPEGKGE